MSDELKKSNDDLDLDTSSSEQFKIFTVPKPGSEHHIYLGDTIEENYKYMDLCHKLRTFTDEDHVKLYLANFGGNMYAGNLIISAMSDCKAYITTIVTAPIFSMASIIALAGDNMLVKSPAFLMFHNYTSLELGKGGALKAAVEHGDKFARQLSENVIGKFLFPEEHKAIRSDKDVYIHWDDSKLLERYARKWPESYKKLYIQQKRAGNVK